MMMMFHEGGPSMFGLLCCGLIGNPLALAAVVAAFVAKSKGARIGLGAASLLVGGATLLAGLAAYFYWMNVVEGALAFADIGNVDVVAIAAAAAGIPAERVFRIAGIAFAIARGADGVERLGKLAGLFGKKLGGLFLVAGGAAPVSALKRIFGLPLGAANVFHGIGIDAACERIIACLAALPQALFAGELFDKFAETGLTLGQRALGGGLAGA